MVFDVVPLVCGDALHMPPRIHRNNGSIQSSSYTTPPNQGPPLAFLPCRLENGPLQESLSDNDDCFYYHSWGNNVVIGFGTLSTFLT